MVLAAAVPARAQVLLYDLTEPGEFIEHDQTIGACGDVDGDGLPDFLIGVPTDDTVATNAGVVRVHGGKDAAVLFQLYGAKKYDYLSYAVDGAGDVNADGFPDVIAGGGKSNSLARVWSGADGSLLHEKVAGTYDFFGNSVTGLGDFDLDGFDDFAVGAPQDEAFHPGNGYVRLYSGFDGALFQTLQGECLKAEFGASIDAIQDVTGDGAPELAVYQTALYPGCDGKVKVFGAGGLLVHEFPADGPLSFGPYGVADAGDLDGDGFADIVVGNAGNCVAGAAPANAKAYSGLTGAEILSVAGPSGCTWFGRAVDGVGDWNGDGRDDVAVGAPGPKTLDIYSGLDQSLLVRIDSPSGGTYGYGVAGLGDLDADGNVEIGSVGAGPGAWVHSACPGKTETYAFGCKGTNDFVPKLAVTGCPNPGKQLVFHVTRGFGGQPAFLAFGTGPGMVSIGGTCKLLVSPLLTVVPIGALSDFGPGLGHKDVPLTVPPGTSGTTFTVQAAVLDPFTPLGFAVSNAFSIDVL
jgi:hypothetical protein